jgi:hypothetical protein
MVSDSMKPRSIARYFRFLTFTRCFDLSLY